MGRLYAISDIHGCFSPFYRLVVDEIRLDKNDKLILLGDYIDRGPQSLEVVDFIIDLQKKGFDLTALTGNHEQMLLDALKDPAAVYQWYMNHGMTTLASFGIKDITEMNSSYIGFFRSLEFYKKVGEYIFVHAGFNDYEDDPFSDRFTMVWECSPAYHNPLLGGMKIIHGHRPKTITFVNDLIGRNSDVIPVDTGCVYDREQGYGNLSALELTTMKLISVPNV